MSSAIWVSEKLWDFNNEKIESNCFWFFSFKFTFFEAKIADSIESPHDSVRYLMVKLD